MSDKINFDISKLPLELFKEIEGFLEMSNLFNKIDDMARYLVEKFNVDEITNLSVDKSITVLKDIIKIQIANKISINNFLRTEKRALILPHCCRKYMDSRCKAEFNQEISSYICKHCSEDCIVYQSSKLAEKENYDVYILPGASCLRKILEKNYYDGIIGVACTEELKLAWEKLKHQKLSVQGIPLIKNGC
jgi:hypothetical protein